MWTIALGGPISAQCLASKQPWLFGSAALQVVSSLSPSGSVAEVRFGVKPLSAGLLGPEARRPHLRRGFPCLGVP